MAQPDMMRMLMDCAQACGQTLKIRIEVDTDPPGEFTTESKFLLQPIPSPLRSDLVAMGGWAEVSLAERSERKPAPQRDEVTA